MQFRDITHVRVGGATKSDLLARLERRSISLNGYAEILFAASEFTTSDEVRNLRIVFVSLPELGLHDGGTYDEIVERASDLGLQQCPLEVAPHLRLHYVDQPEGPYLTVASQKLRPEDSFPNGLYLRRLDGSLWLRGYNSGPENLYAPDFSRFAFICPEP